MELLVSGQTGNIINETRRIDALLVGKLPMDDFRRSLKLRNELFIFKHAAEASEFELAIKNDPPDIIMAFPDENPHGESFERKLMTLCRLQMNSRTIVLCDKPFRYLHIALKTKVAALLSLKTDRSDLEIIIREVCGG